MSIQEVIFTTSIVRRIIFTVFRATKATFKRLLMLFLNYVILNDREDLIKSTGCRLLVLYAFGVMSLRYDDFRSRLRMLWNLSRSLLLTSLTFWDFLW